MTHPCLWHRRCLTFHPQLLSRRAPRRPVAQMRRLSHVAQVIEIMQDCCGSKINIDIDIKIKIKIKIRIKIKICRDLSQRMAQHGLF
jgi:hypothetical protein